MLVEYLLYTKDMNLLTNEQTKTVGLSMYTYHTQYIYVVYIYSTIILRVSYYLYNICIGVINSSNYQCVCSSCNG